MTQQQHGKPERVYTMIGAVVMAMAMAGDGPETTRLRIAAFLREEQARTQAWSPEMETAMLSAVRTPEICPDRVIVESHRDVD